MENVVSDNLKIVYTEPVVEYEDQKEGDKTTGYAKKVTIDGPECKKVVMLRALSTTVGRIKASGLLGPKVSEDGELVVLDVQGWTEPFVQLRLGVDLAKFLLEFVQNQLELVDADTAPEKVVESMPASYSFITTSISFLKFLEFKNAKVLDALEAHLKTTYPPILVLMNLNGFLLHRTNDIIKFVQPENQSEEQKF